METQGKAVYTDGCKARGCKKGGGNPEEEKEKGKESEGAPDTWQ